MAKKTKLVLVVVMAFMLALFTACSGDSDIKQPSNVDVNHSESTQDSSESNDVMDEADGASSEEAQVTAPAGEITIAETEIYNADGVVVTVTGFEDGWMGPEINVLVENNSDQNILITSDALSANGFMMPYASLYAEVAAGKKSNESISLLSSELEQASVETIADIQFYLTISDADSWDTLNTSDLITLETSAAGYEQPVDDSGDVLYDAKDIKIVCKGLMKDYIWDGTVVFYLENNSNAPITVYAENVSVNGFMQDVSMWSDLRAGTKLFDGMYLLDLSNLELESMDEIEEIEFSLRIINSDTWDTIVATDAITLTF